MHIATIEGRVIDGLDSRESFALSAATTKATRQTWSYDSLSSRGYLSGFVGGYLNRQELLFSCAINS